MTGTRRVPKPIREMVIPKRQPKVANLAFVPSATRYLDLVWPDDSLIREAGRSFLSPPTVVDDEELQETAPTRPPLITENLKFLALA